MADRALAACAARRVYVCDRHQRWELVSRESPEVALLAAGCVISYWLRL